MTQQGIKEGPPIWVESLMTTEEWKDRVKKYPTTSQLKEPPQYNPNKYEGGTWRAGMGQKFTALQLELMEKAMTKMLEFLQKKEEI